MFYKFLLPLSDVFGPFNLFKYLTFRTIGAVLTAFIFSFLLGDSFISWLKKQQKEGQPIRENGPESHLLTKKGTPTMGGVLILGSLAFSTILWSDWRNNYVWIILLTTLFFGLIGAFDDYLKLTKRSHEGLSGKGKLVAQTTVAFLAVVAITYFQPAAVKYGLPVPFLKGFLIPLHWFFYIFGILVIVGSSNAVNLTDGLDGLAIGPVMTTGIVFCIISYLVGNHLFANYLQLFYIPNAGELSIFCGALIGSGLGFLWFNAPPAKVFMGDTGSLSTGAALAAIAIVTKHELVLALVGGLFVVEAVSVMLQVMVYKRTKKRIFLMAPIHHHFEKKGWAEPTVVIRFWIIAILLALIGLSTLKLR